MNQVRQPQQQRSIDKKNKIIQAGYKLFAQNGYYNTNTVQIAKEASVSTGIVYGYFRDKRDILLETLDIYIENAFAPTFELFDKMSFLDIDTLLPSIIDCAIESHKNNEAMHKILHSLTATDEEISQKFLQLEYQMTQKTVEKLRFFRFDRPDIYQRVHLAMETIQSYAHECVFDKHTYIDYSSMRSIVIQMLKGLFV